MLDTHKRRACINEAIIDAWIGLEDRLDKYLLDGGIERNGDVGESRLLSDAYRSAKTMAGVDR
jgi:hypothetical protein